MLKNFNLKTPSNINSWWNFGSLISFFMFMQFLMGFFLSMNYLLLNNKFNNSIFIYTNINFGWMMRLFHSNLTSMIFILFIIHIFRNMNFNTYFNKLMWLTGMFMLLIYMLISFLGYTLTWTQMSYWGMMVITNFISIIPIYGKSLMLWLWGNFKINIILINRFFSIHFILPTLMFLFIFIHLNILHNFKSNNPLGINNKIDLTNLMSKFIIKDLMMFLFFFIILMNIIFLKSFLFYDFDNFNKMNYFKTPNHIKPEWYFLFFYSILRSIENKFSGLMYMMISIMMFFFIPLFNFFFYQSNYFKMINKMKILMIFFLMIFISIFGSKNIEYPYILMNKLMINFFFILMFILN